MHFTLASAVLAIAAATSASAADHQVTVGNGALAFVPNTITATPGDTVTFVFYPKNHTVSQSSFAAPCQPLATGADSGFQPVTANATQVPSFSLTVNDTTPTWWFCRQTAHCEQGMVFAINPTQNKTFLAFQATANASSSSGVPPSSNPSSSSGSGTSALNPSGTGSSPSSATSSTSKSNSAISIGARAGGLLAAIGFAAGLLL